MPNFSEVAFIGNTQRFKLELISSEGPCFICKYLFNEA
jgi:hypothetical protein